MNQSSNGLKIRFAVGFIIVAGLMAVIVISLLSHAGTASANSNDLANAEAAFPVMVGSRIDTCALCHTASVPALNPYGLAYKAAGRSMAAALAIQNVDTDGDGFTNLQEINAFTFPGDPNDHPASAIATNTLPAPTNTKQAPTNTQPAGPTATQPAGLIATKTKVPIMTLTPGAGEPAKTKEATEVESTEQGKTPEPTETGGENKDQKTPNPNPRPTEKVHMTRTAGPTQVEPTEQGKTPEPTETGGDHKDQKTPNPNPQPTEKVHMTRTAGPTQVCNTPTPGVNTDDQHRNPCGQNNGGKNTSGANQDGNIFVSAWNFLFHKNHH